MSKQQTDAAKPAESEAAATPAPEVKPPHCGIIMPIGDTPGYDPGHWLEVRRLIVRAAKQAGYTSGMVSENDGQDVIHRSIVKNIYHNPLVVCDVSSLNPNVMLELGLRMANKKPLIIVFDGEGVYPFDIKNMLYIPYPKGLHHFKVENFVQELTARMVQVTEADKDGKYEPFLNHFNDVVIEESKLGTTTQSMMETLADLVEEVRGIKSDLRERPNGKRNKTQSNAEIRVTPREAELAMSVMNSFLVNSTSKPSSGDWNTILGKVQSAIRNIYWQLPALEVEDRLAALEPELQLMVMSKFPE